MKRLLLMLVSACNADSFTVTDAAACLPSDAGPATCVTDGGGDPDAAGCAFKHPLLDGSARFCAPAECYCKWSAGESCYPATLVATCCASTSLVCY